MIFKGRKYRRSTTLIDLPQSHWQNNYVTFGKILPLASKYPAAAVKTDYKWPQNDQPVWAIPIKLDGHSRTNLAYGPKKENGDYAMYLLLDGKVYQGKGNVDKNRAAREMNEKRRIEEPTSPHPFMDCPKCGEFMGHGHQCKESK